jgi:hypothetical protein
VWEPHHEISNCVVGQCRISSCGLLGTLCLRNLPINKRTTEGPLGSRELNLPDCDSWQALPISLYEALAANAVTYALVGLILETLRHRLHHAK